MYRDPESRGYMANLVWLEHKCCQVSRKVSEVVGRGQTTVLVSRDRVWALSGGH